MILKNIYNSNIKILKINQLKKDINMTQFKKERTKRLQLNQRKEYCKKYSYYQMRILNLKMRYIRGQNLKYQNQEK